MLRWEIVPQLIMYKLTHIKAQPGEYRAVIVEVIISPARTDKKYYYQSELGLMRIIIIRARLSMDGR